MADAPTTRSSLFALAATFLRLGCTSFGGPVAHLGYLHAEFVVRRRKFDEAEFADLAALCQVLPGPASSQLVYAIGGKYAGTAGAIVASLAFLAPSAILMVGFAFASGAAAGAARLDGATGLSGGARAGLLAAAVAVVAEAVRRMALRLCTTRRHAALAAAAAAATLAFPAVATGPAVIVAAALVGFAWERGASGPRLPRPANAAAPSEPPASGDASGDASPTPPAPVPAATARAAPRRGAALLAVAVALWPLSALVAAAGGGKPAEAFAAFYRSGFLVFGGGHVVLPLLRGSLVPRGYVSDETFLAGYGAVQAAPGPMFSFAGYLGAASFAGERPLLGAGLALLAVYLPAWLLVAGALPFWRTLRSRPTLRAATAGADASVVGVLFAAFCTPVVSEGAATPATAALAAVAFGALVSGRVHPLVLVVGAALAGHALGLG